jgi:hypothetical protein
MSEHVNDGGQAFPGMASMVFGQESGHLPGMSLRDWFAGQSMMGIIANPNNARQVTIEQMARDAYVFADAILAAREPGQ